MEEQLDRRAASLLLHARHVMGSLAAGFMVAVPIQLVLRGKEVQIFQSLAWGIVFLLGQVLLIPVSHFDWSGVRVPRFKRFQKSVSFYAAMTAAALFVLSFLFETMAANRSVFWFVLVLAFFNLVRRMAEAWFFPGFYGPGEGGSPPDLPATRIDEGARRRNP